MRSSYPLVFIPKAIEKAQQTIPLLPKRPSEPIAPQPAKASIYWLVLPLLLAILTVLLNILLQYQLFSELIGLLIIAATPMLAYFGLYRVQQKLLYSKHQEQLQIYAARLEEYQANLRIYHAQCLQQETENYLQAFHYQEVVNVLKTARKPSRVQRPVPEGRAEQTFHSYLTRHFGKQIKYNLQLGQFERAYVPDFCLIDESVGLYIDIEIDEPYTATNRQPIHFVGADDERNDFFVRAGWIVIRFAEEQIVKYPDTCCTQIQAVIDYIFGRCDKISYCVPAVQHWTREEANHLATIGHREYFR